jgi:hypothetical protein
MTMAFVKRLMMGAAIAAALPMGACSIDVREDEPGDRKDVDIRTPVGGMSVRTGVAADTGLAVYPDARPLRGDDEPGSADVTIGSALFGMKVVATKFESDAAPDAVLGFYKDQMKSYGEVVECRGDIDFRGRPGSQRPVCRRRMLSHETQLVVGTEEQHRLVSVKRRGGGSEFAVVYIQTRS